MFESAESEMPFDLNPYDSFMRKHLEHYGYYTGRNQGYRTNFALADWEKTYGYQLSSSASSDNEGSESDSDNQKNGGKMIIN